MSGFVRVVWGVSGVDAEALARGDYLGMLDELPIRLGGAPGEVVVEVSGLSELEQAYLYRLLERSYGSVGLMSEGRPEQPQPRQAVPAAPPPIAARQLESGAGAVGEGFDAARHAPPQLRVPAQKWLDELSTMLSAVSAQGMLPPELKARWVAAISSLTSVAAAEALAFECAKAVYNACAKGYEGMAVLLRLQLAGVSSIERALTLAAEQTPEAERTVEA